MNKRDKDVTISYSRSKLRSGIGESKSTLVAFKEHDKMSNGVPTGIPIFIKPFAFM